MIGDLVKFNIVNDDSGWATDKFGVEPQLNGWVTEIYTEELFGEIVRRNTIEVISNGKRTDRLYKIQNNIIPSESSKLRDIRNIIDIPLEDIFEGSEVKTVKDFQTITKVPFLELGSKWEFHSCLNEHPKHSEELSIWEKGNIGRTLKPSAYFDGGWTKIKPSQFSSKYDDLDLLKLTSHVHSIRPKSLSGIEDNNGWISIKEKRPEIGDKIISYRELSERIIEDIEIVTREFLTWYDMNNITYWKYYNSKPPIY